MPHDNDSPADPSTSPAAIAARLRAIESSASAIPSLEDRRFLEREDLRPFRLAIDYLKPQLILEEEGIHSTIVVFGSARVIERPAAEARVAALQAAADAHPEDAALARRLAVAKRLLAKSQYYDVARELGRIVSTTCQIGGKCEFVIATGGGPGIMEAGNRGAWEVGAKSVGYNITLPHEQFPNSWITPSLCFNFHYFATRKMHFMLRARALVAFPGGYGTFDELFETLCLVQTGKIPPLPIVLVGREFWQGAFDLQFLVAEGVIDESDAELFVVLETAEEIWAHIADWWQRRGQTIVGP
jgi:uncharacterized protein (TIGR00730 family)